MPHPAIVEILVSWVTEFSEDGWSHLEAIKSSLLTRRKPRDPQEIEALSFGPVLPDDGNSLDSRIATLVVVPHPTQVDGRPKIDGRPDELLWTMAVRPRPDSEPPPSVKEDNLKFGGRSGLIKSVLDWAAPPPVGRFRVDLAVPGDTYDCRVLPVALDRACAGIHEPAVALAESIHLEQIGYRFENGANGLEEVAIVYLHESSTFRVGIRARGMIKLQSATWHPYADEIAELVLGTFFALKGSQDEVL